MHICKDLNPASFDHLCKSALTFNKKSQKKRQICKIELRGQLV